MPNYVYECRHGHGRFETYRPHELAGHPIYCDDCLEGHEGAAALSARMEEVGMMRRIFTPLAFKIQPSGWNLRPGEPGYSDFNRELELGEVRNVGDLKRYGPAPEEEEAPAPAPIRVPDAAMQEIHELGRVIDRQVREEMSLPAAILDLVS